MDVRAQAAHGRATGRCTRRRPTALRLCAGLRAAGGRASTTATSCCARRSPTWRRWSARLPAPTSRSAPRPCTTRPRAPSPARSRPRCWSRSASHAVILGHSERRQYFAENDTELAQKVRVALDHGLLPVLCCGETDDERVAGRTAEKIGRQIDRDLAARQAPTSSPPSPSPTSPSGRSARARRRPPRSPRRRWPSCARACAQNLRRGGRRACASSTAAASRRRNIDELMAQPDIDGVLVGGASLEPAEFARIARFDDGVTDARRTARTARESAAFVAGRRALAHGAHLPARRARHPRRLGPRPAGLGQRRRAGRHARRSTASGRAARTARSKPRAAPSACPTARWATPRSGI